VVIVCGMLIGTLFTLFVLPAIYTWLARDHRLTTLRQVQLAEAFSDSLKKASTR